MVSDRQENPEIKIYHLKVEHGKFRTIDEMEKEADDFFDKQKKAEETDGEVLG